MKNEKKLSSRGIYERSVSEEDIVKQIVSYLALNRIRVDRIVERIPWGRKTSTPGIPDLMCRIPKGWNGRPEATVFFIEVKKPGGKLRPAQEAWLREADEDGVLAFMAMSSLGVCEVLRSYGIDVISV